MSDEVVAEGRSRRERKRARPAPIVRSVTWHAYGSQLPVFNAERKPVTLKIIPALDKGVDFVEDESEWINYRKNHIQVSTTVAASNVDVAAPEQPRIAFVEHNGQMLPVTRMTVEVVGLRCCTEDMDDDPLERVGLEGLRILGRLTLIQSSATRNRAEQRAPPPKEVEVGATVVCERLHYRAATAHNSRRQGRPNPRQEYVSLLSILRVHTKERDMPVEIGIMASTPFIVRGGNPGLHAVPKAKRPRAASEPHGWGSSTAAGRAHFRSRDGVVRGTVIESMSGAHDAAEDAERSGDEDEPTERRYPGPSYPAFYPSHRAADPYAMPTVLDQHQMSYAPYYAYVPMIQSGPPPSSGGGGSGAPAGMGPPRYPMGGARAYMEEPAPIVPTSGWRQLAPVPSMLPHHPHHHLSGPSSGRYGQEGAAASPSPAYNWPPQPVFFPPPMASQMNFAPMAYKTSGGAAATLAMPASVQSAAADARAASSSNLLTPSGTGRPSQ